MTEPRSRRRPHLPARGWRRGLLVVSVVLALIVAGCAAFLVSTRVPLVPVRPAADSGPTIGPTGDWPDAPVNSQYGTIKVGYDCTLRAAGVLPVLKTHISVAMTGIFPLTAAANQPFYVTDGKGDATLPAATVNRLRGLGVRQVQGHTTRIDILALGSTPDIRNAVPAIRPSLPPTRLVEDTPLVLRTPTTGAFRIGPFQAARGTVEIGIGAVRAELSAVFVKGFTLPTKVVVECPQPDPVDLVALITIGGKPSATPVDIAGTLKPASLPLDSGLLGAIIPYRCQVGGYGIYTVPTNVNAFIRQLYVRAGQRFSFVYGHGYVTIPPALTDALLARHPTAATADVTLTRLGTVTDNATPTDQNYLTKPVTGAPLPLTRGKSVVVHFPPPGQVLPPATYTAGQVGILRIYLGNSTGVITLRDKAGRAVGTPAPLTCATMRPLTPLLPYVVAPTLSAGQG